MPAPHPKEFRDDVVALARKVESLTAQLATDFGISESCLRKWMRQTDVEDGVRLGGTGRTHYADVGIRPTLATGIAIRACHAGHRVLFATASEWVDRLAGAHHDERRYPLLVVDEVASCGNRGRPSVAGVRPVGPSSARWLRAKTDTRGRITRASGRATELAPISACG
jgi:hypothetical protein